MRRILCNRRTTIVSSVCTAVDGGRATIAASFPTAGDGFLPTDPKPNVKVGAKFTDNFSVFVGQSAWARKQLKNEERARKDLGIMFRDYGGRATRDDELVDEKVAKANICKVSEEELDVFVTNLEIECGMDREKYRFGRKVFYKVIERMNKNDRDDELVDAIQNDKVDKLAEIAGEELDAFVTNLFTTKLMIECEPKYEKRFRQVIEKVRKKMIQDDGILKAFELVTYLMSKCEPEYEKLLCEVLEKVCEKITEDDRDEKVGNENIRKIEKLAKLDVKVGNKCSFEEKLDEFVTEKFRTNLRMVEKMKPYFMAYEVIEKVAKKLGNENVRKIAEQKLDALVTDSFVSKIVGVEMNKPFFMYLRLKRVGAQKK